MVQQRQSSPHLYASSIEINLEWIGWTSYLSDCCSGVRLSSSERPNWERGKSTGLLREVGVLGVTIPAKYASATLVTSITWSTAGLHSIASATLPKSATDEAKHSNPRFDLLLYRPWVLSVANDAAQQRNTSTFRNMQQQKEQLAVSHHHSISHSSCKASVTVLSISNLLQKVRNFSEN